MTSARCWSALTTSTWPSLSSVSSNCRRFRMALWYFPVFVHKLYRCFTSELSGILRSLLYIPSNYFLESPLPRVLVFPKWNCGTLYILLVLDDLKPKKEFRHRIASVFFFQNIGPVPWLRRLVLGLLPRRPGFNSRPFHVGLALDKVALGQVLLRAFRVPLSVSSTSGPHSLIHLSHTHIYRAIFATDSASSETRPYSRSVTAGRLQAQSICLSGRRWHPPGLCARQYSTQFPCFIEFHK
jgi:hypothetical protein